MQTVNEESKESISIQWLPKGTLRVTISHFGLSDNIFDSFKVVISGKRVENVAVVAGVVIKRARFLFELPQNVNKKNFQDIFSTLED